MLRKLLLVLLGAVIALPMIAGLAGIKLLQFKTMGDAFAEMTMPPEPVNAAEVFEYTRQPQIPAVGTVMSVQGTMVRNEVEGLVREILFEAGSNIEAGQPLVRLDTELEQAQLREAEATAELSRISLKRAQELRKSKYIAQSEFDSIRTGVKQADAQVDYVRAVIAKKTIRAPFSGTLGIRQISVGQFLNKGDEIVSLQSLDPVYVDFSLPQQHQGELRTGLTVQVKADAYPEQPFEGRITAFNPDVDPATRNIRVQATLSNPQGFLRPGMYVSLEVLKGMTEKVLMLPATAVQYGPYGSTLFVIEASEENPESLVIRQQSVTLGKHMGDFVEVLQGVKAGDRVVSTGVFKLRPGMTVVVDNSLAPEFKFEPTPNNS
ncbi:MexH family multidrug efflux RND transporter periplasmic adaptor subunit [Marinobacterium zhoushanense]|uniref:MexH family multidrug efflux RND transporter periplasmic adaptor subunit n=1 Tax=Marinobacterium zhoushanense TaxID=1679163 RepID=A0ABQ1KCT9_9GAMM|nr:efflux RND transporter periplasmic adaptor subunit [Marinobacterium zhoushanense]GGB91361.1 MexH family multidrug efflux RND transporter periplasmic adaptor subunit [Marinobacterium zhoushanense]